MKNTLVYGMNNIELLIQFQKKQLIEIYIQNMDFMISKHIKCNLFIQEIIKNIIFKVKDILMI